MGLGVSSRSLILPLQVVLWLKGRPVTLSVKWSHMVGAVCRPSTPVLAGLVLPPMYNAPMVLLHVHFLWYSEWWMNAATASAASFPG